jgi:hypothetical protein
MDDDKPGSAPEDPSGIPEPHDVLAAEEFGIGTRDQRYPADPTGIPEPHDVLAAEEFAMPSPGDRAEPAVGGVRRDALLPLLLLAFVAGIVLARRARR